MIVDGVLVPVSACGWMATAGRLLRDAARRDGTALPGEVAQLLDELEARARAARADVDRVVDVPYGTSERSADSGEFTMAVVDVAQALGCSERNVRALRARGSLPAVRSGREWRFDPVDVHAYLERKELRCG